MKKIWIAGSTGSGKTTLANFISEKYNIPVYHRDLITWDENSRIRSETEQIEIIKGITQNDCWIFDGCRFTTSMIDGRFENCDTIIYLNNNRFLCLYRTIIRYLKQKKQKFASNDLQEYNWKLTKYILCEYPQKAPERSQILWKAKRAGINVIILNGRKDIEKLCNHFDAKINLVWREYND